MCSVRSCRFWLVAIVGLSTAAAAWAEKTQTQSPLKLTKAQLREAARGITPTSSAAAILAFAAPTANVGVSNAASPAVSLAQRVELAQRQFTSDTAQTVGELVTDAVETAAGPLLDASSAFDGLQAIIGSPTWTRVSNTTAAPYSAVCYVESVWPNGSVTSGTASFAHPRVLLSNAHIVYSSARGGWARRVRVVPGKNGSREPYGSQYSTYFEVPKEWTSGKESNRDYDISWIVLPDRTLFKKVGLTFGYRTLNDRTLTTLNLNLSGYPGIKNGEQWREYVTTDQVVFASQYKHYFDTVGGSSGSPMYQLTGGNRYIVGVNCAEATSKPFYNVATRMTSRYFDETQRINRAFP